MNSTTKSKFNPLRFFKENNYLSSLISIVLTLAFLHLITGCSYYNVKDITTTPKTMHKQIQQYNDADNYIVMHSGDYIWHLDQVVLDIETKTLSGNVQYLNPEHQYDKEREEKRVHRYSKSKQEPFNEVHFTTDNITVPEVNSQVTIPFTDITKISVNEKNSGRSFVNAFSGTIGIIAAVIIIWLLTKSSCPFVYVNNGTDYVFTGELYPGIITPNQQCDDYIPLPNLKPLNDDYCIKVSNELKEIQYTDLVQLITADHPDNVEVLLDKKGIFHSFSSVLSPKKVIIDEMSDDKKPALEKDNISYLFNTEIDDLTSVRNIELAFEKPAQIDKAKLYLTLKNSLWLDYIFGKLNETFGSHYNKFQKEQQSDSKEKTTKWINEQNIPLSVYVKTKDGWQVVDKINAVGPLATRDIVVPIDVSNTTGDLLQIKLETGFMFWEVDYIGIDYSENIPLQLHYLEPYEALDQDNIDVTELLAKTDKNYFIQPHVGDQVVVKFKADEVPANLKRTLFLKNRGYYNYIRDYKGAPKFSKACLFDEAGSFTDFSKYEYKALMEYSNNPEIVLNYEK